MFDMDKNKKILVCLTNQNRLEKRSPEPSSYSGGNPSSSGSGTGSADVNRTGFDVKAVAYIIEYVKEKHGYSIDFCTISGGEAPMDPRSLELSEQDEVVQKFLKNRSFMDQFKNTTKVNRLNPEDYCAIFIPGSHGAMMDLPECQELHSFICKIYEKNGCIATLGHGIAALLNVPAPPSSHPSTNSPFHANFPSLSYLSGSNPSGMTYLLKDKRVCFSTMEEDKKLRVEKSLPYCLEEEIKKRGAKIQNKEPFEVNVIQDGRLVTAQNSQSAKEWVSIIMKHARQQ